MRNPIVLALLLLTASASGFVTPQRPASFVSSQAKPSSTELMVIYWSIKSGIDLAAYGMGFSDKFKGTGVFNAIEFEREKPDAPAETEKADAPAPKATEAKKETVSK